MRAKAKNFLSIAEMDLEIPNGVTLIRGYNHDDGTEEGAGKSAIPNLIFWVLTGEMPKDVNVDQVIKEGQKHCEGSVDLPEFSVFRSRSPNDLHIKEKDGKIWRGKDANETQKEIVRRLGMSFKTICQSVYFAQNYPNKFVTANQENKGKILSEILDLDQFDRARKIAADRIKPLKEDLVKAEKTLLEMQLTYDNEKKNVDTYTKLIEEFQKEKTAKIQKMIMEHAKIQEEAENFIVEFRAEQKRNIDQANSCIQDLKEEIKKIETKRTKLESKIEKDSDFEGALTELENAHKEVLVAVNNMLVKLKTLDSEEKAQCRRERELQVKQADLEALDSSLIKINSQIADAEKYSGDCEEELSKAVQAQENPSKEACPTCGQAWDGNVEHYAKEVKKAKVNLARAEKMLLELKEDRVRYKASKKPMLEAMETLRLEISEFKPQDASKLQKSLEKENGNLEAISAAMTEVRNQEKEARDSASELKYLDSKLKDLKSDITRNKEIIETWQEKASPDKQLAKFKDRADLLEKDIEAEDAREPETLQTKLKTSSDKLSGLENTFHLAEDAVYDIKDHVNRLEALREGYREVKAYTFENTLRLLNSKANMYLTQLFNQQVKICFKNEDLKIETMVQIDGQERPLGLYSGGQFRRVALAVDLALADVTLARKGNSLNILVLDEYFKDLSATSMGRVLKILQNRKTPTLLIEHNDLFKSIVNSTIEIELRNGTTSVIN